MDHIQDRIRKLSLEMLKKSGMYNAPEDGSDSDQYRKLSLDAHLSKTTKGASPPSVRFVPPQQTGNRRRREGVVHQDYKFQGFKQDHADQAPCPENTWLNLSRMSTCAKETKDLAQKFETEGHPKHRKWSELQREEAPRNRRISEQVHDRQRFTSTRCQQGALEHGPADTGATRRRSTPVRPLLELVRREDVTELMFSISYQPHTELLTLTVIKARNLTRTQSQTPDSYVKVTLMYGEKKIDRKKTSVRSGSLNPTFNESFMFDVTREDMRSVSLTLTVAEVEQGMLGKCEIGPWTEQWREMMDTSPKPATRWCQMKEITPSCKSPAV
ncbi:SYT9 [Branchiostoma lanceolatum]|uniref:SYT9 protein n=1 Tax=Branchiostoma lanceolatum TaxID=7740 RepID=A0A8J9VV62_BRALA|nr:SYT9 [Branchiostoma lanceolatum]